MIRGIQLTQHVAKLSITISIIYLRIIQSAILWVGVLHVWTTLPPTPDLIFECIDIFITRVYLNGKGEINFIKSDDTLRDICLNLVYSPGPQLIR